MKIGVLAFQGSVREHLAMLKRCRAKAQEVRSLKDLKEVDALIIPGGESTTIGKLLKTSGLDKEMKRRVKKGFPIYGTCAGAILMAKKAHGKEPDILKIMDIEVERNAYGRQKESFTTKIDVPIMKKRNIPAVFIRAPKINKVGKKVKILAKREGEIVLAQQGNLLISTFHPEMTDDTSIHTYFLSLLTSKR